jgi:hypothetical protein
MFNFEYTGIFQKHWTYLESYYLITQYHMNIQYGPNFRASIVFYSRFWYLKSAVISATRGYQLLSTKFLKMFSPFLIALYKTNRQSHQRFQLEVIII